MTIPLIVFEVAGLAGDPLLPAGRLLFRIEGRKLFFGLDGESIFSREPGSYSVLTFFEVFQARKIFEEKILIASFMQKFSAFFLENAGN